MTLSARLVFVALLCVGVLADIYMHNPRGSNNRNCRNDNGQNRRNANRLFDSQNNDKGGYSCPRAYPFLTEDNGDSAAVDEFGNIVSSTANKHIDTDTMFYYAGTKLHLEWTSQHACGSNDNLDCRIVMQYMCNTDNEGADNFLKSVTTNPYLRDGTPINNNDNDNTNDEATTKIPADPEDNACNSDDCEKDGRYGFQEPYAWYDWCTKRQRNFGLFTADQLPLTPNGGNNKAINTRQNPNGGENNRYGLECPEEKDYYPYWAPSVWKDIAVGVSDTQLKTCNNMVQDSQNVKNMCYCDLSGVANPTTPYAITSDDCAVQQGQWKCAGSWNLEAPECFALPWTRDNHLGNSVNGYAHSYNWTLPEVPEGQDSMRCVLRIRYNTTTGDFKQNLDRRHNCAPNDQTCTNSPISDRNKREELTYMHFFDESNERYKLSMAVNTDQHARTFQDRSYAFDIRRVPTDIKETCGKDIVNINVRGKRGNIVQTYPAVEYDFVPQDVEVEAEDCLHIQWIGSDYNPNRNPNDAEGGPYNPNQNNEAKADRTNLIQTFNSSFNYPANHSNHTEERFKFLFTDSEGNMDADVIKRLAFIDQDIADCDTFEQLVERNPNDRNARERDPRNCAKLNAARTPYFSGGVFKVFSEGLHRFLSTRNNNFSNRSQKLKVRVKPCTTNCSSGSQSGLTGAQVFGVVVAVGAAIGLLGFALHKGGYLKSAVAKARGGTV